MKEKLCHINVKLTNLLLNLVMYTTMIYYHYLACWKYLLTLAFVRHFCWRVAVNFVRPMSLQTWCNTLYIYCEIGLTNSIARLLYNERYLWEYFMTHIDYDTFNNKQQFNISRKMIHGYDIMICHMIYSSSIC